MLLAMIMPNLFKAGLDKFLSVAISSLKFDFKAI